MPTRPRIQAESLADPDDAALYPRLSTDQIRRLAEAGTTREIEPGHMLFDRGVREAPFHVLELGSVDILDRRPDGDVHITTVPAGTFLGDVAMFTGAPTVAAAVAAGHCRVIELDHAQLRRLIAQDTELGDLILRTFLLRRSWLEGHGYGMLELLGPDDCPETFRLRNFLSRNQIPFRWRDTAHCDETCSLLSGLDIEDEDLPVIVCADHVCRRPSLLDAARALGLRPDLDGTTFDLVVVGAGPGGLAAAVYGASEGLGVLVVDAEAPGGQAGASSKIENYLGFVTGLSGDELARAATLQARKFGATIANPAVVERIDCESDELVLSLDDGERVRARCVVLAAGARYRTLEAANREKFEGAGVYYAATHLEASGCRDRDVLVIGGGNSAGQAAVFLSRYARRVTVAIRRASLAATMSRYLIDRIESTPNIELLCECHVVGLEGEGRLDRVVLEMEGERRTRDVSSVFVMIGAEPSTGWLAGCCALDARGFVLTGADAQGAAGAQWPLERTPFYLETSRPGVFAVGDIRSGSVKRVAAAVGEGSMAIRYVHEFLAAGAG